jgi:hypothetical protein
MKIFPLSQVIFDRKSKVMCELQVKTTASRRPLIDFGQPMRRYEALSIRKVMGSWSWVMGFVLLPITYHLLPYIF